MKLRENIDKSRGRAWRMRVRTAGYRIALFLFGLVRPARLRNLRKWQKKWHGPLWRRIGGYFFGTNVQLALDVNEHIMYVRPDQINDLIALFGRPEENLVKDMIRSLRPGDVFVDAGAYIGQYTLLAADQVGNTGVVIAVEPNANNFELLRLNVEENRVTNSRLLNIALGGQDGMVNLVSVPEDAALSTLEPAWVSRLYPEMDLDQQVTTVEVRTVATVMKELKLDHIDLLKVDVEGAELHVLRGALELLQSGNIRCVVCEPHGTATEVLRFFEKLGYRVKTTPQVIVAHAGDRGEAFR